MASGGAVERRPQSVEDDPANSKDDAAAASDTKQDVEVKKPRPTLKSTAKTVGASVRDLVKKNKAARLLQKIFRRKRKKKKKKGIKGSKLDEIPEVDAAAEEEEAGEGRAEEADEEVDAQNDTAEEDTTASMEEAVSGDKGEVDDGRLAPVDETAESNKGAQGLFTVIDESDKVKSKAEVGEIEKDHIKSVSELAKLMQSRDEETRKKNEESKVKYSAAAHFYEGTTEGTAVVLKGKSPEVRKAPLHF